MSRRELLLAGVSRRAIDHRLRMRVLQPLLRGVYAFGHPHPQARLASALLVAGPGSALSHWTTAWLRRLVPSEPEVVHVTTARQHGTAHRGIVLHRAVLPAADVETLDGIPVTSVVRTLHDLAACLPLTGLERVVDAAYTRRLATPASLRRALRPGRPGAARLASLLDATRGLTRSEAERRLIGLLRRARLPAPTTNVRVHGYEVDALWPRQRLIVEVDGYAFHSGKGAFERDRRRDADLLAAGYRTLRVTWRELTEAPEAVAVRIAGLLA